MSWFAFGFTMVTLFFMMDSLLRHLAPASPPMPPGPRPLIVQVTDSSGLCRTYAMQIDSEMDVTDTDGARRIVLTRSAEHAVRLHIILDEDT